MQKIGDKDYFFWGGALFTQNANNCSINSLLYGVLLEPYDERPDYENGAGMNFGRLIYLIGFFIFGYCNYILSASPDSLVCYGIEKSIEQDYSAAESLFTDLIARNPADPQYYFFLAAVIQTKMMDFESLRWETEFLTMLSLTENKARALLTADPENAWGHFYLGSAYSYRAFYEGRSKSYMAAIRHARLGIKSLKQAIQLDSTLYDAYFGLGSYKYWRSRVTRYLNWLPLLRDERDEGIRLVKIAAARGRYTRWAALNQLTWILIDYGRVSDALTWAKQGLNRFPASRFFLWGNAKCYFNLHQYRQAQHFYEQILNSVLQESLNNHYNEIICYLKLAQCHYHQREFTTAMAYCERVFQTDVTLDIRGRLKDIYHKTDKLHKHILQELNK